MSGDKVSCICRLIDRVADTVIQLASRWGICLVAALVWKWELLFWGLLAGRP